MNVSDLLKNVCILVVSPGCEEQEEHQQQPLQVEDGVAVAALQHPDQPKPAQWIVSRE